MQQYFICAFCKKNNPKIGRKTKFCNKSCKDKYWHIHRDQEKRAAWNKMWLKSGRLKEYKKNERIFFREKYLARRRTKYAIKKGLLNKPNICECCRNYFEDKTKIHAHHKNYKNHLDVLFLCAKCHSNKHHLKDRQMTLSIC